MRATSGEIELCSDYKKVGVLPMRIVWSNVSSIGPSSERKTCSDWLAILEKNKILIFASAFGDRRLGRAVSGAASRSEAMGSMPTRDFPPWLSCF